MHPYARRLLDLVGSTPPIQVLSASPTLIEQLHRKLQLGALDKSYAPGKWVARTIFCHLADVEVVVALRIRQTLTISKYQVDVIDQDKYAASYGGLDVGVAVAAYAGLRAWNLSLVRSLSANQLESIAHHPERGEESIAQLVAMLAGHDLNHLGQLQRIEP